MSYKDYLASQARPELVYRKAKTRYNCERVLSTEVLPLLRGREYERNLNLIAQAHRDAWYIHYQFFHNNASEAVRRVPSVTFQFNRSRVLRRAKISGARMCTLTHYSPTSYLYVTDMAVSCTYDAMVFASYLNRFKAFDNCVRIGIKLDMDLWGRRNKKLLLKQREDELIDKFFRRSKLPRNCVTFERQEVDICLGLEAEFVVTSTKPIFDVVALIVEAFGDTLRWIDFGKHAEFRMSRSSLIDLDLYTFCPFDGMVEKFQYRQFSTFGIYADSQALLSLKANSNQ